jgi:prepilin-type processing-associated H-X9-DG protein
MVELLLLAGASLILLSLWLPQLVKWREAARRRTCVGNLQQIGQAMEAYHQAYQALPPGYMPDGFQRQKSGGVTWSGNEPSYAWSVFLLPHLGHETIYQKLAVGEVSLRAAVADAGKLKILQAPLAVYRCPSNLAGPSFASAPIHPESRFLDEQMNRQPEIVAGGSLSYVASGGYFALNIPLSLGPESNFGRRPSRKANNGLFSVGCSVRHEDITDGLSNTLAVGERGFFQGSSNWVGVQSVKTEPSASICLGRVYWRINEIPSEFFELPQPEFELATPKKNFYVSRYESAKGGFSSYHLGGAHFLFADGQVRFLANEIDFYNTIHLFANNPEQPIPRIEELGVFQKLGIRNDGQAIDGF